MTQEEYEKMQDERLTKIISLAKNENLNVDISPCKDWGEFNTDDQPHLLQYPVCEINADNSLMPVLLYMSLAGRVSLVYIPMGNQSVTLKVDYINLATHIKNILNV